MKFKLNVIISFITGRLYSDVAPTELFAELGKHLTGIYPQTYLLPRLGTDFRQTVLSQCPEKLQGILNNWKHTDNWREEIQELEKEFPEIELK